MDTGKTEIERLCLLPQGADREGGLVAVSFLKCLSNSYGQKGAGGTEENDGLCLGNLQSVQRGSDMGTGLKNPSRQRGRGLQYVPGIVWSVCKHELIRFHTIL